MAGTRKIAAIVVTDVVGYSRLAETAKYFILAAVCGVFCDEFVF